MPKYIVRGAMLREEDHRRENYADWRPYYKEIETEKDLAPVIVAQNEFERLLGEYRALRTTMIPIFFNECWSAERKSD